MRSIFDVWYLTSPSYEIPKQYHAFTSGILQHSVQTSKMHVTCLMVISHRGSQVLMPLLPLGYSKPTIFVPKTLAVALIIRIQGLGCLPSPN